MPRIRVLPDSLINRIAAGEVVERPSSAVKELVENSLDAEAGRIGIELAEGGRSLIRVTDDGIGMDPDDALLALERHATSKIESLSDLDHIASLGFDLYAQMLERASRELRGETVEERVPATLHLGIDIKVPESFMPDVGDRLVLYKRLASARDGAEVDRLQADAEDRFGHLPPPAVNLFDIGRLRLVAEAAGVRSVEAAEGKLRIRFRESPPVEPRALVEAVARLRGTVAPSGMLTLPAPARATERIRAVREALKELRV